MEPSAGPASPGRKRQPPPVAKWVLGNARPVARWVLGNGACVVKWVLGNGGVRCQVGTRQRPPTLPSGYLATGVAVPNADLSRKNTGAKYPLGTAAPVAKWVLGNRGRRAKGRTGSMHR